MASAPWHVRNSNLHRDLQVNVVSSEIQSIFLLIYLQHAPLHYYALLHACFILYIYVVSITFIHLVVTVPFIPYQSLLSL